MAIRRKKASEETVEIQRMRLERVIVPIEGETELIVHNWSEKSKRMMLDKQMGKVVKRENKDPEEDYESSMYKFSDGGIGFPAGAFKAACVGACRHFKNLPMTKVKVAMRVEGKPGSDGVPLVKISGKPRMREDTVRLETGVADLRYRAGFPEWTANLEITYNADIISLEQLYNLVDAAGYGGVGEWRPSAPKNASGSFGCFHVKRDKVKA